MINSIGAGSSSTVSNNATPVVTPVANVIAQNVQNVQNVQSTQDVQRKVLQLTNSLSKINRDVSVEYNKKIDAVVITIRDGGAVVRTIPSREFIRMQIALNDMIGAILNKKG